jgi:MFS transporter, UMF1 family
MTTTINGVKEATYKKRINAWAMYDWANSAFATTILAALLPVYYSTIAGSTLPSEATATAYWSITLSLSLFIIAIMSPILGTVSDVMRGKKRFLAIFIGIGVVGTGLLIFVNTGDWLLASLFFVLGRIGFGGANVFYDALLPHVAKEEDQDWVSTRGYAFGYLGGGILLAINVVMFLYIPDTLFENAGIRLSFLSVAIWWAVFSLPILRRIPEPPSATATLKAGQSVIGVSLGRLRETFGNMRKYGELFKYLTAFLIYNDAIGTIIGVAAIYGAELGFGLIELVLALLMVQFVGIPFAIIFGSLPATDNKRAPLYLAFIIFNVVALPISGIALATILPLEVSGAEPAPYVTESEYVGEGLYRFDNEALTATGSWDELLISGDDLVGEGIMGSLTTLLTGRPDDVTYVTTDENNAGYGFTFNGQNLILTYRINPDGGVMAINVDGMPLTISETDADGNEIEVPLTIDTYNLTTRYDERVTLELPSAGNQTLEIVNISDQTETAQGNIIAFTTLEVEVPVRESSLPTIIGIIIVIQIVGAIFAMIFQNYFTNLANWLDTRRSILFALVVYSIVAAWGFVLNTTVEFWLLAWMVAMVQGGSQALSRSLYSSMCPLSESGEFFGFYSIMEKFASIIGPLLFAFAGIALGSSRPAILSLIALFILGGYLLTRVDIEKGQQTAREEDAKYGIEHNV